MGLLTVSEASRVSLLTADATRPGALPAGTTHIYVANLCFPEQLARAMAVAFAALPLLECVVAIRPLGDDVLPLLGRPQCHMASVAEPVLDMSWNDAVPTHAYCCTQKPAVVPAGTATR